MSHSVTQIVAEKHIAIKSHQVSRLLAFINMAHKSFQELQTLATLIGEKSEAHTTAHTLSAITSDKLDQWQEYCDDELNFFREFSPELIAEFDKELS